jgi:short-subunit dehydrogenase
VVHFKAKISSTNSNIAIVPAVGLSAYSSSKAALNAFVMCLREELQYNKSPIKIIELWPPPVQTEIHDNVMPEGAKFGMPVEDYVNETYLGIVEGKDFVQIGDLGPDKIFQDIIAKRIGLFDNLSSIIWTRQT